MNLTGELTDLIAQLDGAWPDSKEAKLVYACRVGRLVRVAREELGWTVEKLAKRADVNPSAVYRLEAGTKLPSVSVMGRIANTLETAAVDGG